jgi:hypothetical protein
VPHPREVVVKSLQHSETVFLPRGELFIGIDFLDRHFPQIAGDYPSQMQAAGRRLGLSAVGVDLNTAGSHAILCAGGFGKIEEYFSIGCINGPFSRLVRAEGFVGAMISSRKTPRLFGELASRQMKEMETTLRLAVRNRFQAIALADDIAGKNGLLFSPNYFAETILPVYQDMAAMIRAQGLFTFLHSDGDMRAVIELLISAGFDCIHPVDSQGRFDLYDLSEQFGGRVSFMGHLDLMAWDKARIADEVNSAEQAFGAKGGLILGSAGGISLDVAEEALSALYPQTAEGESKE